MNDQLSGCVPLALEESSTALIPQSITTAPFFIQVPGMNSGLPIPATKISACPTISCKFSVFEWQIVTVQSCHLRSSLIGVPTILDRPVTKAVYSKPPQGGAKKLENKLKSRGKSRRSSEFIGYSLYSHNNRIIASTIQNHCHLLAKRATYI